MKKRFNCFHDCGEWNRSFSVHAWTLSEVLARSAPEIENYGGEITIRRNGVVIAHLRPGDGIDFGRSTIVAEINTLEQKTEVIVIREHLTDFEYLTEVSNPIC